MSFYEPLAWTVLESATAGLILFDEFTQISRPDVEAASYPCILDRLAGFVEFNSDVMVVAAGNTPEHSSIAHMISTPLVSRFKIVEIEDPTIDEWSNWMDSSYGDAWDRRILAFHKMFEEEHLFFRVPKLRESLKPYPVPRTWTWLARETILGFDSPDDIYGYVGYETGSKLIAFLKTNVDFEGLIAKPETFGGLSLDGQYMATVMYGTWLTKHKKEMEKSFPLLDSMAKIRHEFLVLACHSIKKDNVIPFLKEFLGGNSPYKKYQTVLTNIIVKIKQEIRV